MVFTRGGCAYILTNKYNSVLYTGVSSDLLTRVWKHKNKNDPTCFTARYNCNKLVYYISFPTIEEAIAEEKRIKGSSRTYKKQLIDSFNAEWKDLYDVLLNE